MSVNHSTNIPVEIEGEIWKDVPGWEGLYQVSDMGRVRSFDKWVCSGYERRARKFVKGRILSSSFKGHKHNKYNQVNLCRKGTSKAFDVHRLVLLVFVGPCPPGMYARHLDGDQSNNRLSNLKWGTNSENQLDKFRHGTDMRGDKHWNAKLTWSEVRKIRRLFLKGRSQASLSRQFKICHTVISGIVRNKIWKEE